MKIPRARPFAQLRSLGFFGFALRSLCGLGGPLSGAFGQRDGVDLGVERDAQRVEVATETRWDDAHTIELHRERIDELLDSSCIHALDCEMQVRPCRAAGLADVPDELTRLDVL